MVSWEATFGERRRRAGWNGGKIMKMVTAFWTFPFDPGTNGNRLDHPAIHLRFRTRRLLFVGSKPLRPWTFLEKILAVTMS